MAMQTLSMLRTEVKFRFIEYLKTSKSPYYEPALTVCPCCGQHASHQGVSKRLGIHRLHSLLPITLPYIIILSGPKGPKNDIQETAV